MEDVRRSDVELHSTKRSVRSNSFAQVARRQHLRARLGSDLLKVWMATAIIGTLFVAMAYGGTMTSWGMQTSTRAGVGAVLVTVALGIFLSGIPIIRYCKGVRHLRDTTQINHKRNLPYI
jgi:hypothetical protein